MTMLCAKKIIIVLTIDESCWNTGKNRPKKQKKTKQTNKKKNKNKNSIYIYMCVCVGKIFNSKKAISADEVRKPNPSALYIWLHLKEN